MSWGPAFLDVLLTIDVVMAALAIMVYVQTAYQKPAFHIWFMMANANAGNILYLCSATTANLMIGRLGKDGNVYSTVASCVFTSGFLWWFINYTHKKAIENFVEDRENFLPGSCPLCTLHRAGAHYKFIKRGAPVPEHPKCLEQSE